MPSEAGGFFDIVPYPSGLMTPSPARDRQDWPRVYLGVFFTALATLLLELSLTRLFSVVFYYHFAFLAISIALFGLGGGGLFSYLMGRSREGYARRAATMLLANAVVIPTALFLFLRLEAEPGPLMLAAVFLIAAIPFFFAGAVLSLVISETIERVERVYFFDLLGAASGCLLLIPFLNSFGGPNTILASAVTFAAAASLWFSASRMPAMRAFCVGAALVLVCLMVVNGKTRIMDLAFAKGKPLGEELFVRWNSFSRVALRLPAGQSQPEIVIDGDASTGIPPFDLDALSPENRETLLSMGPGFVYRLRPALPTLVIGAGGGWDVARAIAGGSKDVTAVEINPAIAKTIMQDRYAELSKRLYFRPEVRLAIEDGRSFVRSAQSQYGVVQLTLVDTWASTAAGAFALTENNLYTTEAVRDYLRVLQPEGVLSFSRWGFRVPRESLRLVALARAAFASMGVQDIRRHVLVVRENSQLLEGWGALDTVLISRSPWRQEDLETAVRVAQEENLEVVYLPGTPGDTAFHQLLLAEDLKAFYESYAFDVSPVNDNRPFFFYTVQSRDWPNMLGALSQGTADYNINRALPTLLALFAISIGATVFVLLLPRVVLRVHLPQDTRVRSFLLYFVLIGAGYILVQISAIQRFVLLLGHPTYSLTVIVFSMLVFTGLGSFLSKRIVGNRPERLRTVLLLAAAELGLLALVVGPLTEAAVAWHPTLKIALTIAMVGLPAFSLGVPFPMGLRVLERLHAPSVQWAWALNAAASVLGSATAMLLAITLGLRETMLAGCLCYLLAVGALWLLPRHALEYAIASKSPQSN
jgi:SAM-dependent methyltransferase